MSRSPIRLLILDVDGTLTDRGIYVSAQGDQFKRFDARDGMGIKLALRAGVQVGIISHSLVSEMILTRARDLGIPHVYVGQEPKIQVLHQWLNQLDIPPDETAYIGDDVNDLEVMQAVGHAACPSDAAERIKKISDVILTQKGGFGAVREYIDQYLLKE